MTHAEQALEQDRAQDREHEHAPPRSSNAVPTSVHAEGEPTVAEVPAEAHAQLYDETAPASDFPTPHQPPAFVPTVADLEEALRDVVDPELGINIVDLGLVYGVTVDAQGHCVVDMTLTSAACPLTDVIEDQTAMALGSLVASHRINWVWMPPWGPDKITDEGREQLRALGFNL